jgi:hypothetical protein
MHITMIKAKRLPRVRPWTVAIAAGWIVVFTGGVLLHELSHLDIPLCALKLVAGIPCPVCGSLRLGEALLRGEIGAAFLLNPLVFCLGATACALVVLRLGFGRVIRVIASTREKIFFLITGILLVAADWAYLIIDGR